MRKTLLRAHVLALVVVLIGAASAAAIVLRAGNLVITTDGGFTPTKLPKKGHAPIKLHGFGNIDTEDGSPPPILETVTILFDKHGEVETKGLPVCTPGRLAATTVPQARKLCPGAIVGKGFAKAVVIFPEQPPIGASSALTLFNARPKHGNPRVLIHAHLTVPAPSTFVVPVEIQRVNSGPLRVQDRGENTADRRRLRHPPLRASVHRAQMEVQAEDDELRQRPLPRRAPAGQGHIRIQRRNLSPGFCVQKMHGEVIDREDRFPKPPSLPPSWRSDVLGAHR